MEFLFALGGAIAGLFIAVVLSGLLAGTVTYGIIELKLRSTVQSQVLRDLDLALVRALSRRGFRSCAIRVVSARTPGRGFAETSYYAEKYLARLESTARRGEAISKQVGLPGDALCRLPYRQLCGQIAAKVNAEMVAAEDKRSPGVLTDILAAVSLHRDRGRRLRDRDIDSKTLVARAIAEIDFLQLRLSEAVNRRAYSLSAAMIAILFVTLAIPGAPYLNLAADNDAFILRGVGLAFALLMAVIFMVLLAMAASVVAALTFRWLDRVASAH